MFENLYSLNVFTSKIEGLDNKKLAELALEEAENLEKRKSENPSATGFEDSPLDHNAPAVKQLRATMKRTIHQRIEPRAQEGEIWAHVLRRGETTQIHSHRNKGSPAFRGAGGPPLEAWPEKRNPGELPGSAPPPGDAEKP